MKKELLKLLKTTYKNLGFSDRAFNRVASYLEKTISDGASEEDMQTAVDGVDDLLTAFQSDIDTRAAKYKADAEKWQEAQKKKDEGASADADDDDPAPQSKPASDKSKKSDDMPAWAKALVKQNEELKGELIELRSGKVADSRKLTLEAKLKGVNPKLRTRVLKDFSRMQFENDEEFNDYVEETVADLEDFGQETADTGLGAPGAPLVGTASKNPTSKQVDSDIAAWAAAEKPKADKA